jgi:hypothetical protein
MNTRRKSAVEFMLKRINEGEISRRRITIAAEGVGISYEQLVSDLVTEANRFGDHHALAVLRAFAGKKSVYERRERGSYAEEKRRI